MRRLFYPKPKFPSVKQSQQTIVYGFVATVVIISIVLPQIMTMEEFILQASINSRSGVFIAVTSIVSGILALPYLMRMALSPLFRLLSVISGLYFCVLWIAVGAWVTTAEFYEFGVPLYGGLSKYFPEDIIFLILVTSIVIVLSAIWGLRKDIK